MTLQLLPVSRTYARCVVIALLCGGSVAHAQIRGNGEETERAAARRAAVASARGQLEAAQARMKAAEERVRAEAKAKPEANVAQTELDEAQVALDKLSAPVLERLRDNPDYQAALREEADAARKLREEQAKAVAQQPASTSPSDVPAKADPQDDVTVAKEEQSLNVPVPTDGQMVAAVDKLDIKSRRREMEAEALAADATTAQALARVDAATAKLKQQRAEYEATLLNDPEYRAAREALATARAELTRAAAGNY